MDIFRAFLKIKIREGKLAEFSSSAAEMIQIVKATEGNCLQYEAFANQEKGEILWLESYAQNTDIDFHLSNPALDELKLHMMPMQEAILDFAFLAEPSKNTLEGLKAYGIDARALKEVPGGFNRLTEERTSNNIQTIEIVTAKDAEAFDSFISKVRAVSSLHPGYLFAQSYIISDQQRLLINEFASEESLRSWLDIFTPQFGTEFQTLIENFEMISAAGSASESLKQLAGQWNSEIFERVGGFSRYSKAAV
ncbi:MAG: antibiotic biosynthesis monooxygenase [Bacteroidia bacterium]|nr:antibiotic biosynthesis monooxygenase [Bacteroidia bacterium]